MFVYHYLKRHYLWFLGGVVAALALVPLYHSVISATPPHAAIQPSFSYACRGDARSILCLEQQYQQYTQRYGVKAAFVKLKSAYPESKDVQAYCHQLTHVIGRTAADNARSVDDAYAQGDNFCWSGYYHGVMESIVSRIGRSALPSAVPTICAEIKAKKPYSFYHYNCVHGLGHGIMDATDSNLYQSLSICNLLTDSWEQGSCYGGVFMENEMDEVNPDHHTAYFKADQPMYPCTAVDDRYKTQCYLMQTSHALRMASDSFPQVFAECAAIDSRYQATCYQSLGRDASGTSTSDVQQTKRKCMYGPTPDARQNCFIGAVKDFISYYHSDVQAEILCQALSQDLETVCETTKTEYYRTF